MDLSEKSSSEDHVSYHPWQQFDPSPIENQMNNNSSSASCPSVSMVDSYRSSFYSHQALPLPVGGWSGQGILPPSLSSFPARFSCFNGGDNKNGEAAVVAAMELSGDGQENYSSRGGGSDSAKKRKRSNQSWSRCKELRIRRVQRKESRIAQSLQMELRIKITFMSELGAAKQPIAIVLQKE